MNFDNIIHQRHSVRKYADKPVSNEMIQALLESARLAPSAVNFQPWKFLVCTSEEAKQIVRDSYSREWIRQAPVYIVACGDHSTSWKRAHDGKDHCDIDVAIAVEHIVLKATELGLGTCWVCNFDTEKIKSGLALSENMEPIAVLPIGYPHNENVADARNKKRKATDEIVEWK